MAGENKPNADKKMKIKRGLLELNLYGKDEEKVKKIKEKINKERDMLEHDIRPILADHYRKNGYEITQERSPSTHVGHPYDLVVGKIDKSKYDKKEELLIIGFEIKSDRDNFSRLKTQLSSYNKYCDEVYVVVHKKKVPTEYLTDAGLIRVSKKGYFYIEKYCYSSRIRYDDVAGKTDVDILLNQQGLGSRHSTLKEIFEMTPKIWRKVLFNRFFGRVDYNSRKFTKFFPFTKEETAFIMKSQFDWQLKNLKRKSKELSRMTTTLQLIADDINGFRGQETLEKRIEDEKEKRKNSLKRFVDK